MRAQCCICSDLFVNNGTNIAATACGHVFHEHCLARWLLSSSTCPSCRKNVVQNTVIPKLYFDIADEDLDEKDPEQVVSELQSLKSQVAELTQEKHEQRTKANDLRDKLKQREEELKNVKKEGRGQQAVFAEQQLVLEQYERQLQEHKEEKVQFRRTQKKLTELRDVEILTEGGEKESEDLLQQYSNGDRSGMQQLAKYAAILRREYQQAKAEKKALKEQLDKQKKGNYAATQELADLKTCNKCLQEQYVQSEKELKEAERTIATLKVKVSKFKYGKKHPGETSGSFLETPKHLDLSDNVFTETPKFPDKDINRKNLLITPKMTKPSGSDMIDLDTSADVDLMNASMDLFDPYPATPQENMDEAENPRVFKSSTTASYGKACQHTLVNAGKKEDLFPLSKSKEKVFKISSAASTAKAPKRVRAEAEEVAESFPLSTLNIMKKREKTGQLLTKTIIRKDYNGLGGTSNFTQPLGPPKFIVSKGPKRIVKRTKLTSSSLNPSLPTLDGFVDLSCDV